MNLTDNQRHFVEAGITHPEIAEHIRDFWLLYDRLRETGELPKIEANPHIETDFFKLVGYPFAVRTGHAEMIADLDGVITRLKDGTIENPWQPHQDN